jgi:hypothetical protein
MIVGPASAFVPETPGPRAQEPSAQAFGAQLACAKGAPVSVRPERTTLSAAQASNTIAEAWTNRFGTPPTENTLAILTAQWSHETGEGKSMFNYNFAGIKGVGPSGLQVTQRTREGYGNQEKVIRDSFRAYETALEGASDYLGLLSRKYPGALDAARGGDVSAFVDGLHKGGYFTGDKRAYERSVARRADALLTESAGATESPPSAPERLNYVAERAPLAHQSVSSRIQEPRDTATLQPFDSELSPLSSRKTELTSALQLETFTDHLALAALRIARATDPSQG